MTSSSSAPIAPPVLVVRPDPVRATIWGALGLVLAAAGIWLAVDTRGDPIAVLAMVMFLGGAAWFLVQWILPSRYTVTFDDAGVHMQLPWWREPRGIGWDQVHLVQVNALAGDPFLEIQIRTAHGLDTRGVILPVGADVPAVHRWLDAYYGG